MQCVTRITTEPFLLLIGTKEDVISVEEQFLAGVYTPEFLKPAEGSEEEASVPQESTTTNKGTLL